MKNKTLHDELRMLCGVDETHEESWRPTLLMGVDCIVEILRDRAKCSWRSIAIGFETPAQAKAVCAVLSDRGIGAVADDCVLRVRWAPESRTRISSYSCDVSIAPDWGVKAAVWLQ